MKIKHILYITLLLFSLLPLYVFGLFMIYENNQKIESVMRENLAAISGSQIMDMKTFCETRKESMDTVAKLNIVHDAIKVSLGEKETAAWSSQDYLMNILLERKNYNPFIESLSIVNCNFKVVISTEEYKKNELSKLMNMEQAYLNRGFFITDLYEREIDGEPRRVVAAMEGVVDGDRVIGYVVEEINTSFFDQFRSDTNFWKDGTLYIIDGRDHLITAGYPGEKTRKNFITDINERENYRKAWESVDREKYPSGEISYSIRGDEYITYYSDLAYTDWVIQFTVNLSSHVKSSEAYRFLFIITIVIITLLLFIINFLLTRRFTRPIDRIAETLERVQDEQNYTLRVENYGKDEIGSLSEKVNKLLLYIEQENIQEKERQRYLARKAERDPLTGVKNKKAMEEQMQDMAQQAIEENRKIAAGFLDIDDFREYNTRYGHQGGDQVIRFVASVLSEYVDGAVGRNGGDEFLFCISSSSAIAAAEQTVKNILKKLDEGMYHRETGTCIPVPCSIGVVVEEGKDISYSSLIRCADEAMYQAKHKGKNTYWFYSRTREKGDGQQE